MFQNLSPKPVYWTTLFVVLFATLNGYLGVGLGSGFGETSVATFYSVGLLATTSWVAFQTAANRHEPDEIDQNGARFFWSFIGFAFAFLALDEAVQIHENLDKLIHIVLGLEETALTDRLDDLILVGYALAGLFVIIRFRSELIHSKTAPCFLIIAFALFSISAMTDILSNRSEYLDWLGVAEDRRELIKTHVTVLEEATKLLAGASLLLAFSRPLVQLRQNADSVKAAK